MQRPVRTHRLPGPWLVAVLLAAGCAGQVPPAEEGGDRGPGAVLPADAAITDLGTPWDAGDSDAGPGPLTPRVENTTCALPDPPRPGNMELVPAYGDVRLTRPLWFGHAPGAPGLRYVIEQGGRVVVFDAAEPAGARTFFDLAVSRAGNEEGLLGMAFHPGHARNRKLYLYYSAANPRRSVLSEFTAVDAWSVDPGSERVLMEIPQPYSNHNGGDVHFGPDGYLYVSLGDGGSGGDPQNHAQRPETVLGAVLRIDVDRPDPVCGTPYGVPADNPFAQGRCQGGEVAGQPEVWAWGLRNTWRMSFDPGSGALWGADVGQDEVEEINILVRGGNYGWKPVEGDRCYVAGCDPSAFLPPVHTYGHDQGESITGGLVYRGAQYPELWGAYLFADYQSGALWALRQQTGQAPEITLLAQTGLRITAFGTDPDGEVFVTAFNGSGLYRLQRRADAPPVTPVPRQLSQTGCFTDTARDELAPGVVPYEPRAPFWSDNARKPRYFALPPGTRLGWRDDDSFDFPVGAVLIKNFDMPQPDGSALRFETRILHKSNVGWIGYSYRWNDEQTDAVLLDGPQTRMIQGPQTVQAWDYPSRSQCNACHTPEARYALGTTARQLNFEWAYPSGQRANQLAALAEAG
ncbi:MAG: PQQ-dependent sugar dehydrogenase, partial [Myxococcales bacterium]|nr:PQQ-dependent sugar dehydrogenase [Myxococcales bacterium]